MKSIFSSKTFWVNVLALLALITQQLTGKVIISVELQTGLLAVINVVLRSITKEEVTWK